MKDIYRALQERLDLFSIGFPPAPSGVEITILKKLFSEKDAELFLKLTPLLGCETCVDRCQTKALTMNEDALAALNPDRCIGCGLCVITCPSEALSMQAKSPQDRYQLPMDGMEQMLALAKKRGIL